MSDIIAWLSDIITWQTGLPNLIGLTGPNLFFWTIFAVGIAAFLCVALVIRQSSSSKQLNEPYVIAILAMAFGLFLVNYYAPGEVFRGDGHSHIGKTWIMFDILKSGELPIWTNKWYLGYPFAIFYGPLFYVLGAFFTWIAGGDVFIGAKITLWLLHLFSGLAMYIFARIRFQASVPAIIAATAYTISWLHLSTIRTEGALPLSLLFLLAPIVFLVLECFLRQMITMGSASVITGLLLSLIILTKIDRGAYFILIFLIAIAWLAFWCLVGRDWACVGRLTLLSAVSGMVALILSAWFLVPFVTESGPLIMGDYLPKGEGIPSPIINPINMKDLLVPFVKWSRLRPFTGMSYLGITILAFACVGLTDLSSMHSRAKNIGYKFYPHFLFLAVLVLMLVNKYMNIFWLLFVCLLAGHGVLVVERIAQKSRWKEYIPAFAIALIIVDLSLTLIQGPFLRLDNSKIHALQDKISGQGLPPSRVMVLTPRPNTFWRSLDPVNTGASTPFGGIMELSPRTHDHTAAIANRLALELIDAPVATLSPLSRILLRLINTGNVIIRSEQSSVEVLEIPKASPVIFSEQLRVTDIKPSSRTFGMAVRPLYKARKMDSNYVESIALNMGVDLFKPLAVMILVNSALNGIEFGGMQPDHNSHQDEGADFQLISAEETHTTFSFQYKASHSGFARLSYAHFPQLKISIDDKPIESLPDALGFIVIKIPEGKHNVLVKAGISRTRELLCGLSILGALIMLVYLISVPLRKSGSSAKLDLR